MNIIKNAYLNGLITSDQAIDALSERVNNLEKELQGYYVSIRAKPSMFRDEIDFHCEKDPALSLAEKRSHTFKPRFITMNTSGNKIDSRLEEAIAQKHVDELKKFSLDVREAFAGFNTTAQAFAKPQMTQEQIDELNNISKTIDDQD